MRVTNSTRANEGYADDLNRNRALSSDVTSTGNRLSETTTHEHDYDLEGNLTLRRDKGTGEIMDLTWDHRNRLTKVELRPSVEAAATNTLVYFYDYRDLMIGRTEDGGSTVRTPYGKDDMPHSKSTGADAEPTRIFSMCQATPPNSTLRSGAKAKACSGCTPITWDLCVP